jgi:hypothetical protein
MRLPDPPQSDPAIAGLSGLLRSGRWSAVPIATIESLIDGGGSSNDRVRGNVSFARDRRHDRLNRPFEEAS